MDELITQATTADARAHGPAVAALPVGSFEQHGAHLPLATDTVIACLIARKLADDHGLFLLPPITISCSHEHAHMAGTVSISAGTLYAMVHDIWRSLAASGVPGLVIVNGHGGNYVLQNAVQEINVGTPPRVALFPVHEDRSRARADAGLESSGSEDMHAGEFEVSLLLHGAPHLVQEGIESDDHSAPSRPHLLTLGMAGYTPNGVIGRPSLASAAKGKALLDSLSRSARAHLDVITGAQR
ncbi:MULTISPECIES: creatininase family protein [Streptomyces]|uniref:creatininase family protein n=1 Tax=Streptomyces TaxID=1883 RepID=UPI00163D01B0|nr:MULTISPECIES: creatininase family protein [Streptomyces]MBC2877325.1 creatininase family protein [Streptomyces sp. TYQ1024]UBI38133.1 creatininase family protein [Streptomyces mobaraensis]UKW30719.1 creatininase family protein [Streptomyces sp. TYQ1024]